MNNIPIAIDHVDTVVDWLGSCGVAFDATSNQIGPAEDANTAIKDPARFEVVFDEVLEEIPVKATEVQIRASIDGASTILESWQKAGTFGQPHEGPQSDAKLLAEKMEQHLMANKGKKVYFQPEDGVVVVLLPSSQPLPQYMRENGLQIITHNRGGEILN